MRIETSAKEVLKYLCMATACFVSLDLGIVSRFGFDHDQVYGLVPLFDLNAENNIPTFFSAALLMAASILLAVSACVSKRAAEPWIAWAALAVIFLFLSFDEVMLVHESVIRPMRAVLPETSFLRHAWVVPYGIAVLLLAALYSRFLMRLPKQTRNLFLLSGGLYVFAAISLEMLGAHYLSLYETETVIFALLCTLEEALEMFGVSLFIYAVLGHFISRHGSLDVSFGPGE